MLVIRRRCGESVMIGPDVELEILEVGPSQVKLGIRAPREVTQVGAIGRVKRLDLIVAAGSDEFVLLADE